MGRSDSSDANVNITKYTSVKCKIAAHIYEINAEFNKCCGEKGLEQMRIYQKVWKRGSARGPNIFFYRVQTTIVYWKVYGRLALEECRKDRKMWLVMSKTSFMVEVCEHIRYLHQDNLWKQHAKKSIVLVTFLDTKKSIQTQLTVLQRVKNMHRVGQTLLNTMNSYIYRTKSDGPDFGS